MLPENCCTRLPHQGGERRPNDLAPSGAVAGTYAWADGPRGVWKTPAGIEVPLTTRHIRARPHAMLG